MAAGINHASQKKPKQFELRQQSRGKSAVNSQFVLDRSYVIRAVRYARRGCALMSAGAALLWAGAALAQNGPAGAAAPAGASPQAEGLQEIVVTGTLIRGTGAPVGSTLIAVDQADLQASGGNDVQSMLLNVPQVSSLGTSEAQRSGTGGAVNIVWGNSINLRGLSPFATLTLVDGHRSTPTGTADATVDPDSFPSIMLQKIDIVADGASATYGSDAIAGVANLILRRDAEGVDMSAREGWADGYQERQLGVLAGHNWGSGQVTFGYENVYHSALMGEDRSFFESDQTAQGGGDYRSSQCNPGNIVIGKTSYAIPAGGVTPATANLLVPNTLNQCDTAKYQDILPEVEHNNVAVTFDQKAGDSISFYGDATYARRSFTQGVEQSAGPFEVPTTNAYFVAPPGAALSPCSPAPGAPLCEQVDYNFGSVLGNQATSYGYSENYQGTLGVNFKLSHDWQLGFDGTAGKDHDRDQQNQELNNGALGPALASSNPATALNVFGGANSAALVNSVYDARFYTPGDIGLQVLEAKLDGVLFHLPGGDVRAAFGTQWRHDELLYGIDSGVPNTPADLVIREQLDRVSKAGYAEFLIPIFGADNAVTGIQRLDLDVAGRYEDYSDFGSTAHPKIGINWVPADGWLVHASYGTSFRAPLLSELVGPLKGVFVQQYSDPQSPTGTSVGYTLGGGNLQLKPETATTYSFGVDYQPIENAKISLNFYDIDYKNQISSYLSDLTILQQSQQLGSLINRCPSAACTALINQYVVPGPVFGPILANPSVFVNGLELNLGTTKTEGIDFQGSYLIPTDHSGKFSVGISGTLVTKFDVQFTPGGPSFDELNTIGYPLRLRFRGNVGWTGGPWSTVAFVNFENSYTNTQTTPNQPVSSFTTLDLNLIFDVGTAFPSAWTKDLRATLHVNNVFNTDPPYVNIPISPNGGGGFDPNVANPIGRLISLALRKKF
jgi:iron complex outermembrane recepter protein